MPTRSDKHGEGLQRVFYPGFDGGLDLAVPNETLPKNELKEALNVEFSSAIGAMRVRGGLVWSGRFEHKIKAVVPVIGRKGFLAQRNNMKTAYYFRWNNIWPVSGTLTSKDGNLSIAAWGDGEYLVASGGKLQKFSDNNVLPNLETITNSPSQCRYVFVRNGRVGVVTGDDTITFSAVGDCESWDNDPNDESTGQFIEIGYKDGMNIVAVVPLSRDLIVFKSPPNEPDKGIIWRITGEFPEWVVLEAAHNTGTFSQKTVVSVGNDVFYISPSGIATLSSVTDYGEVKTAWPDRKVSNALTNLLKDTGQLWDLPIKQQLWVLPSENSKQIWVFDYIRGIWTKFEFPFKAIYATCVDNLVYFFSNTGDIYELNDGYIQDDLYEDGKQDIEAKLRLGTLLTGRQTLIKGAYASFELYPKCNAELILGDFHMPFKSNGEADYIYDAPNDEQYASEDDDALFPDGGVLTSRRKCIVREWAIMPEIKIVGGGCSISTLGFEMVEV